MADLDRRTFIGASLAAGALATTRLALAGAATDNRFVLVLLRGALDGLAAVPPVGDTALASLRGNLAIPPAAVLALDGFFGLHPALPFLHERYRAKELAIVHAVATPYRERSHFDAQDVLETGVSRPHAVPDGWLNRAVGLLPGAGRQAGVALGANVPLVMRGAAEVASWSPSSLAALDEDTLARITDLYAGDPLLSRRLADALASDAIAAGAGVSRTMARAGQRAGRQDATRFGETARAAAGFLSRPDGARIATFETTGWDTHANQGGAEGLLAVRLRGLDAGLRALHDALGSTWQRTVVLVVTEFGRTAAANGTRGTDHGTGAAAFVLGGAVAGGRVIADWPGLGRAGLLDGRDLRPTLDLRALAKGILLDHLGISRQALDTTVFPDSAGVRPVGGILA